MEAETVNGKHSWDAGAWEKGQGARGRKRTDKANINSQDDYNKCMHIGGFLASSKESAGKEGL